MFPVRAQIILCIFTVYQNICSKLFRQPSIQVSADWQGKFHQAAQVHRQIWLSMRWTTIFFKNIQTTGPKQKMQTLIRYNMWHLMPQNAASDQGLHCLPFIQQILDTNTSSKVDVFKFYDSIVRSKPLSCWTQIYKPLQTVQIQISWLLKKPTDLDLHCLPFCMWIYINNLDQGIWLAHN